MVEEVENLAANLQLATIAQRQGFEETRRVVDVGGAVNVREAGGSVREQRGPGKACGIEVLIFSKLLARIADQFWHSDFVTCTGGEGAIIARTPNANDVLVDRVFRSEVVANRSAHHGLEDAREM